MRDLRKAIGAGKGDAKRAISCHSYLAGCGGDESYVLGVRPRDAGAVDKEQGLT